MRAASMLLQLMAIASTVGPVFGFVGDVELRGAADV
jgi:hypothetical protein